MPGAQLHRARTAATLVFFTTGLVFASWAARVPSVQGDLQLTNGELGAAVLGLEGGAIAGLPAGGALVARAGTRRALRTGFAAYPAALCAIGLAPSLAWLVAGLAVFAVANSVIDVAMNAQGVELERRHGGPLLSGLHAGHSFGLLAGGLAGTVAAQAELPVAVHFTAVAALGMSVGTTLPRWLVDEVRRDGDPLLARPRGRLLPLGAVAFCAFGLDGAANNWSAVSLQSEHHADPALAAAAFSTFALAVALARLAGDRLIARVGRLRAVRGGGLIALGGSTVVVLAPSAALAIAGWAVLGAGVAIVAPAVLGAAPTAGAAPAGVAIAAVTTLGYLGSFTGPPLIGAVAQASDLSAALGLLVVGAAAAALLARWAFGPSPAHGSSPGP